MYHLIISLILDNVDYISILDKPSIYNMVLTCKDTHNNVHLQNAITKFYIEYLYQKLLKIFECNCDLKLDYNYDKLQSLRCAEAYIKQITHENTKLKTAFQNYLISEYKELIFNSIIDECFNINFCYVMIEHERYLMENYPHEIINKHKHDPTDILYRYGKQNFKFYENVEKEGSNILDLWTYMVHESYT